MLVVVLEDRPAEARAGERPVSASVALPRRGIVWPTAKRNDVVGASIDGCGGVFPASMRIVAGCDDAPFWSRATTDAVNEPTAV